MLKRTLIFLVFFPLCVFAQTPDWLNADYRSLKYSAEKYFTGYSIRAIQKGENLSQALEKVKDAARVEMAQSIQVHVENVTTDTRLSTAVETMKDYDEKIIETFSSKTQISTDLKLTGLHVDAFRKKKQVFGFAYINRSDVIRQFDQSVVHKLAQLEIQMEDIETLVANGQKREARAKLESLDTLFAAIEVDQKVRLAIDENADLVAIQMPQFISLMQKYTQTMALLKNGVSIYIDCKADVFGQEYSALRQALKGELSSIGCSFLDTAEGADWVITVSATAREYKTTTWGDITTYFAYVDAFLSIQKMATKQVIYENKMSIKGGHTLNYEEAARSIYYDLVSQLGETINSKIQ